MEGEEGGGGVIYIYNITPWKVETSRKKQKEMQIKTNQERNIDVYEYVTYLPFSLQLLM